MLDKESLLKALRLVKDYEAIIVENTQSIDSLTHQVNLLQEEKRRNQTYISGLEHELKALQPAHDLLNDPELIQLVNDMQLSGQPASGQAEVTTNPANEPLSPRGVIAEIKKIGQEFKTNWEHHKS